MMDESNGLICPARDANFLDHDFVTLANPQGIIGDPDFVTRDRMGRDLIFMCRIYLNGWSAAPRERT